MLISAFLLLLASPSPARAADTACFDFDKKVTAPLRAPLPAKQGKDTSESGKTPGKGIWGAMRGEVNRPIQALYHQLLDHYTIKDPARIKLKVYDQERAGYSDFHVVMITLNLPMTTLNWEENWGYATTEGTDADPKRIVISYQKTTGSSFLPHLCGSIVLSATSKDSTDVYLYEEIDALGKRSPDETVKGHRGTFRTLRTPAVVANTAHAEN
jgi:hypothetical protein